MAEIFKMPDLGEGIHEAEIISVMVSKGDKVTEGDPILEVETDKAAVEIPSPFTGTVRQIFVNEGDVVNVGEQLLAVGAAPAQQNPAGGAPGPKAATGEAAAEDTGEGSRSAPVKKTREPVPASPATRRLARELGVDLYAVKPTGPKGLVTAEDVKAHSKMATEPQIPVEIPVLHRKTSRPEVSRTVPAPRAGADDFSRWGPVDHVPVKSIRRATARNMALSWSQIPHAANQDLVDLTRLTALIDQKGEQVKAQGGRLTLTVFALKAVCAALTQFPDFNASYDPDKEEIIRKRYYNIGVAVNTPQGLVVPVIRHVDRKSLFDLSRELSEVAERARSRKTGIEEMQGGTFTISNAGAAGAGFVFPVINYPQVAILGMGQARLSPKVTADGEGVAPALMMPITLSFDHRVVDGVDAIHFMRMVMDLLEDPAEMLMKMV